MRQFGMNAKILIVVVCAAFLSACASGPTYYGSTPAAVQTPPEPELFFNNIGPEDRRFTFHVEDRTPFGLFDLPQARNTLYSKGYDEVRRQNRADFTVSVSFTPGVQDDPQRRAGNVVGGALAGAALGAIIGGATGSAGTGAAIGAASGGTLGLVAPASSPLVRIDLNVYGFNSRLSETTGTTVDISQIPPHEVPGFIDAEVSRMLRNLPPR